MLDINAHVMKVLSRILGKDVSMRRHRLRTRDSRTDTLVQLILQSDIDPFRFHDGAGGVSRPALLSWLQSRYDKRGIQSEKLYGFVIFAMQFAAIKDVAELLDDLLRDRTCVRLLEEQVRSASEIANMHEVVADYAGRSKIYRYHPRERFIESYSFFSWAHKLSIMANGDGVHRYRAMIVNTGKIHLHSFMPPIWIQNEVEKEELKPWAKIGKRRADVQFADWNGFHGRVKIQLGRLGLQESCLVEWGYTTPRLGSQGDQCCYEYRTENMVAWQRGVISFASNYILSNVRCDKGQVRYTTRVIKWKIPFPMPGVARINFALRKCD